MEIPENVKKELEHFKKTRIPRCSICKKNYVKAYDNITKKISEYTWKPSCKHNPNLRISIG